MHTSVYTGLLCTLAAPALGVVLESLAGGVPSTWSLVDKPSADSTMSLSIALTRQNLDQLESKVTKLATPGQAEYGQWLDKSDIDTAFPVVDDASVVKWLKKAGISSYSRSGATLTFSGSVETVEKLLDADFAYYKNGDSTKLRTTAYSIPDDLTDYVDLITPTVYFGNTRSFAPMPSLAKEVRRSSSEISASCSTYITPECIKEMYNVGDYTPEPSAGSRIGFGSFLNESAIESDLAKFETLFDIPSQSFSVELIAGGVNNQSAPMADIGEANLDVQLIVGVSHPLPVHEFITGGVAYVLHCSFRYLPTKYL